MSTRMERMRLPLASDVIAATAEQHGVCVRPFTMEVGDLETGSSGTSLCRAAPRWSLCVGRARGRLGRCG
jgi:hypothetical protein